MTTIGGSPIAPLRKIDVPEHHQELGDPATAKKDGRGTVDGVKKSQLSGLGLMVMRPQVEVLPMEPVHHDLDRSGRPVGLL